MPPWVAHFTVVINDNCSDQFAELIFRYIAAAPNFPDLPWRRVLARTMIGILGRVLPFGTPDVTQPVLDLWNRVLKGDEPTRDEWWDATTDAEAANLRAQSNASKAARDAAWSALSPSWNAVNAAIAVAVNAMVGNSQEQAAKGLARQGLGVDDELPAFEWLSVVTTETLTPNS